MTTKQTYHCPLQRRRAASRRELACSYLASSTQPRRFSAGSHESSDDKSQWSCPSHARRRCSQWDSSTLQLLSRPAYTRRRVVKPDGAVQLQPEGATASAGGAAKFSSFGPGSHTHEGMLSSPDGAVLLPPEGVAASVSGATTPSRLCPGPHTHEGVFFIPGGAVLLQP